MLGTILNISKTDLLHCEKVAAEAFADSPSYRYIFPGMSQPERVSALTWLFEANYKILRSIAPMSMMGVVSADDPSKLVCCFMLRPAPAKVTLPHMVSAGLLELPFRYSWQCLTNTLHASDVGDRLTLASVPEMYRGKFVTLERMVVLPEFQGKGIGSAGLTSACRRILSLGLPVVLNTQEGINVKFYLKNGFSVVREVDAYGCHHWSLLAEPKAPRVIPSAS